MARQDQPAYVDPNDGLTYYGGAPPDRCRHDWQEMPGEPREDVCVSCGAVKY